MTEILDLIKRTSGMAAASMPIVILLAAFIFGGDIASVLVILMAPVFGIFLVVAAIHYESEKP